MKIFLIMAMLLMGWGISYAHDGKHPVNSTMKKWFDSLRSGKGPCCSDADGTALSDVDWESRDGLYRVFVRGQWVDVPKDAVLMQPNLYGLTMVWLAPTMNIQIRCFIPGALI